MSGLCPECEQRPIKARGLCGPCYKRLVWRPRGGPAVDKERAASQAWKDAHPGTCEECGGPMHVSSLRTCRECRVIWTPEAVIAALRDYADEHGGVPPVQMAWNPKHPHATAQHRAEYASGRWPSHQTVARTFGSWNAGIIAAGLTPHQLRHRDPAVLEEWRKAVRAGEAVTSIAKRYGVTPEAVYLRLANHGTPVKALRLEATA